MFTSGEAPPARGDWVGIWLNTANGSRLDYVEISYAGAPTGIQSNYCRPINTRDEAALFVGSFSDQYVPPSNLITNSRITNSAGFGINAMWLAGTFNAPDLTATNVFPEQRALPTDVQRVGSAGHMFAWRWLHRELSAVTKSFPDGTKRWR